jgi:Zn-dependent oligopeptidase
MAALLGYVDYPSYVLDVKMAKSLNSVEEFTDKIHQKVVPLAKTDIETLLSYKQVFFHKISQFSLFQEDKKIRNEEYDGILHDWDISYYSNILKEKEYGVDDELVRQYFPMNHVLEKMFDIYQRVLGNAWASP